MNLSPEDKARYERDGFLILPGFASEEECDLLIQEASRLVEEFDPGDQVSFFSSKEQEKLTQKYFLDSADQIHFFFETDAFLPDGKLRQSKNLSINKIGHALHDLNPIFEKFSYQKKLEILCQDIGLKNPRLLQSMYIFKQPRIGGEVISHQDATFVYTDPLSVTGFWFALEDATQTNGCLFALPGGHRLPLKRRFVQSQGRVSFLELDDTPVPEDRFIPLEAKKGTLVLLHGTLPHKSGPNLSDFSRHAYSIHLIDGQAEYPKDNWLQRRPGLPIRGFGSLKETQTELNLIKGSE